MRLDLGVGKESARALGCDLTFDYVKINAEYYARSGRGGRSGQARADRREPAAGRRGAQLHPQVRRQARGHQVRRRGDGRSGAEAQLRRGGGAAAVGRPASPVIVHGGGPEITKTLEKLGRKSEFADGQRITGEGGGPGRRDGADRPDQHRDRRPHQQPGRQRHRPVRQGRAAADRAQAGDAAGQDRPRVRRRDRVRQRRPARHVPREGLHAGHLAGRVRQGRLQLQHQRRRRGGRDRGGVRRRAPDLPDRRRRHPRRGRQR